MKLFSTKTFTLLFVSFLALYPNISTASFGVHLGSHIGIGRLGNETTQVRDRSMGTFDLQAVPGYKILSDSLMVGLLLEYRLLSQLTSAGNVAGEDFSGGGFSLGPAVTYRISLVKILVGYDLISKQSTHTPEGSLSGSAIRFLVGYELFPSLYADLTLNLNSYGDQDRNGTEVLLTNKVKHWNFGFGISYSY
ncbi:MAG: hypothetical protein M9962_12955 [Oligoflexia bacterium]|nr:hypothetical protein [Oligoflexia bacterium]